MIPRRRAVVCLTVAAVLLGAATAAGAPGRAVEEPTPAEAAGAVRGLVKAVGDKAGEIERALENPVPAPDPSLTDDEVTAIAETSGRLQDWIRDRTIVRTATELDDETRVWTVFFVSKDDGEHETVDIRDSDRRTRWDRLIP